MFDTGDGWPESPASPPVRQSASPPVRQSASPPVRQSASPPVRQSASPPVRQSASPGRDRERQGNMTGYDDQTGLGQSVAGRNDPAARSRPGAVGGASPTNIPRVERTSPCAEPVPQWTAAHFPAAAHPLARFKPAVCSIARTKKTLAGQLNSVPEAGCAISARTHKIERSERHMPEPTITPRDQDLDCFHAPLALLQTSHAKAP